MRNDKEKVVDRLLDRINISVDGKHYKVKKGETLTLDSIKTKYEWLIKNGKKL